MEKRTKRNPWYWIPSLYLAEGIPYVAVMTISVIMYKRFGISNADIALYTSWLYLPWVIKPFWSPFVDILKTKRWWILAMEILLGAGLAGIAFFIPVPFFFRATLSVFWLVAFSSATHDIAADGFYMLSLSTHEQAMYVGIRSTFYRIATIMGQGVLIILAGFLESNTGLKPLQLGTEATPGINAVTAVDTVRLQTTNDSKGTASFSISPGTLRMATGAIPKDSATAIKAFAAEQNRLNGFVKRQESKTPQDAKDKGSWWSGHVSTPFGSWIRHNFGESAEIISGGSGSGNIALARIRLSHQPSPGESRILVMKFDKGDKSISIAGDDRFVFNKNNWDKPAWIVIQTDPKLDRFSTATFKGTSGNIPLAWSITFFIMAGLFIAFFLYHRFMLPYPLTDKPAAEATVSNIIREFGSAFGSFFRKKQVVAGIFFFLTYRFAEAQLLKLVTPFLLDTREVGGLGLTTGEVGLVYGTVGILSLTVGGIIGGFTAAKGGLKKWLWPMALSMILTVVTFLYLACKTPESLLIVNICVAIEQFGYGFGFTAYMMYMIYYADGEYKTSHYAICTAFMALGMMIPGMFAGWIQEQLGYRHFFMWVLICSIIPIIATSLLKIDPEFGKKKKEA
jgi:MFS transporter, PAT family, beta-lactamase induction signal transducer AmpG